MLKILITLLYIFCFSITFNNNSFANNSITSEEIVKIFKRSMNHWNINYDTLDENRSGAACIPWKSINKEFIDKGIFIALGYGFSLFDIKIGTKAAVEGCERMRKANKIEETCSCEMILYNDEVLIEVNK